MEITIGHERRLKALGLNASWYLETFQRLGGKCERCGKEETKLHYGQPKPLSVDTSMNPPRLLCQKCSSRKNTANKRRREMEKAAAEEQRLASMTRDEFWNENRKKLKKTERDRLEQRTEEMLFMCDVLDDYLAGTDQTSQQDLLDTVAEVAAEVAEHGVCNLHTILVEFWKPWEKDFYDAVVAKGGAAEKFVKFGYIDAIPSDVYHRFASKFMVKPTTNPMKAEWVVLTCASPDCQRGLPAMPRELANEYAVKGKLLCYRCQDLENTSRAQATIFTDPNKIFDKYGRIDHWRKDA